MNRKILSWWKSISPDAQKGIVLCMVFVGLFYFSEMSMQKNVITTEKFLTLASEREITHGNQEKKQIIFTFDGGSSDISTKAVLEALWKHKVKGTFFLTGQFVEKYPDTVRAIEMGGNEIFNHTYDHPYLTQISNQEIINELAKMDEGLKTVANVSSKPYFRAPYGDRDQRVLKIASLAGYQSVFWSEDALDWEESNGETGMSVKERILSSLKPGNIYLMHLGDSITGNILDEVMTEIENRGYEMVSLSQGIK